MNNGVKFAIYTVHYSRNDWFRLTEYNTVMAKSKNRNKKAMADNVRGKKKAVVAKVIWCEDISVMLLISYRFLKIVNLLRFSFLRTWNWFDFRSTHLKFRSIVKSIRSWVRSAWSMSTGDPECLGREQSTKYATNPLAFLLVRFFKVVPNMFIQYS